MLEAVKQASSPVGLAVRVREAGLLLGCCSLAYILCTAPHVLSDSVVFGALVGNGFGNESVILFCSLFFINLFLYAPIISTTDRHRLPLLTLCLGTLVGLLCMSVVDFQSRQYITSRALSSYSSVAFGLCLGGLIAKSTTPKIWWLVVSAFLSIVTIGLFVTGNAVISSGGVLRASGPSHTPLETASNLALLLVISFGVFAEWKNSGLVGYRWVGILVGIISVALMASLSWAATLAAAAGCIVCSAKLLKRRAVILTVLVSLLCLSTVVLVRTRTPEGDISNRASKTGRLRLIQVSLNRTLKALPWGEGLNSPPISIRNPVTNEPVSSEDPHCGYLFIAQQFGVLGVAYLGGMIAAAAVAARSLDKSAKALLLSAAVALAVLFCFEEVFFTIFAYAFEVFVFMILGMILLTPLQKLTTKEDLLA